jgi:hypothetical protein
VNRLPVELKVYFGKIFVKATLNRTTEAASTVPNIHHTHPEAFAKDKPQQFLNSLVRESCDILSGVGIAPQYFIRQHPWVVGFHKEA